MHQTLKPHPALAAILLLRVAASIFYVVMFPAWETLDEINHFLYATFIVEQGRLPTLDDSPELPAEAMYLVQYNQPPLTALITATALWLGGLQQTPPLPDPTPVSTCPQSLETYFIQGSTAPLTRYALTITRLVGVIAGVASVWITWHASFTLFADRRLADFTALLLAIYPPAVALTAWVNNDHLLMLLGAGLLTVAASPPARNRWLLLVGLALLAMLTKLTGVVAIPFVIGAAYITRQGDWRQLIGVGLGVGGLYLSWNYATCNALICRLYRQDETFNVTKRFTRYLWDAPYAESLYQLLQTGTVPFLRGAVSPSAGLLSGAVLMLGGGLVGLILHRTANKFGWRLGLPGLLVGLAVGLALVRVWWLPFEAFLPVRYLTIAFPAMAILIAYGYDRLGDLLPPRRRQYLWLAVIGWWATLLIITPIRYYLPLTTPPPSNTPAEPMQISINGTSLTLTGYNTSDPAQLTVTLRADSPTPDPLYGVVTLMAADQIPRYQCGDLLGTGAYPTSQWTSSSTVSHTFHLPTLPDVTQAVLSFHPVRPYHYMQASYTHDSISEVSIPLRD
jgi:hypothetical protein